MKRLVLKMIAAAVLGMAGANGAMADNFRLTIGSGHPADAAVWITAMRDYFAPEVAKRAAAKGHKIEWVNAYGGSVCKLGECLEAVETGLLDIADLHVAFEPAKLMAHNFAYFVPFGSGDPAIVAKAARQLGPRVDQRPDGLGAIGGRDSGRRLPACLDGNGEGRPVVRRVLLDHRGEVELVAALLREGDADESAPFAGHEVDGFGRDVLGREAEVSLVLAILIVDDDDEAALPEMLGGRRDGDETQGRTSRPRIATRLQL